VGPHLPELRERYKAVTHTATASASRGRLTVVTSQSAVASVAPPPPTAASNQVDGHRAVSNLRESLPASVTSPKAPVPARDWSYRFYAAFSKNFVRDALTATVNLSSHPTLVLDPWLGSGTSARVAAEMGLAVVGVDINPAMVVLSKARLLQTRELEQALELVDSIVRGQPRSSDDPLARLVARPTAAMLRSIADSLSTSMSRTPGSFDRWAGAQCFAYAALFLATRSIVSKRIGSNPTWVKLSKPGQPAIAEGITWRDLSERIRKAAQSLAVEGPIPESAPTPDIRLGNADSLALDAVVTTVVTSPPYCTRIDYVVATRPELSVLGLQLSEQDSLRRSSQGTTTVPAKESERFLGDEIDTLLSSVRLHGSYASATYYAKWLAQFFDRYVDSLRSISAATADGALMTLVVQDSYFKDIHVDLLAISLARLRALGWQSLRDYHFAVPVTMASINRASRRYRISFEAVETAAVFVKRRS
jgi:hypothetical protein